MTSYKEKARESVALEFGYDNQVIKEVLHQKSFASSGDFVDYLFQLSDKESDNLQQTYSKRLEKEEVRERSVEKEMEDAKLESLRYETKLLYINSKCCNCFSNLRDIVTLPCSHLCLCERCSKKVEKCPACQETISCVIKTFRS